MATERNLQDFLKRVAVSQCVGFYKMECKGRRGFPDVMLAYGGHVVFVELKSPTGNGRLSPSQLKMIEDLTDKGCSTYVTSSHKRCREIVSELIERATERGD